MRSIILTTALLATTLTLGAVEIENNAGNLHSNLADRSITELTVSGTMDVRDFVFIADSLPSLTSLDLSQVNIAAYHSKGKPYLGNIFDFAQGELPAMALMGTRLTNLVLPDSLKSIGHAALAGCSSLETVTMPSTLTAIDSYAFSGTGITVANIPASVTQLGTGAFSRCANLTTVTIAGCNVPAYAFIDDTNLSSVTLSNSVTAIGAGAFSGCTALNGISIDNGIAIRSIGKEAFVGAGAQAIDLAAMQQLQQIGAWAFACSGITAATLPAGVYYMGNGAFYCARSNANATFPEGVTTIPPLTYAGNTLLDGRYTLPEGVDSIGEYAFYNDYAVKSMALPSTTAYIGTRAMAGMTGLDTVSIVATVVPALGDSVWQGVDQPLVKLSTLNNETADLYGEVDQWKNFHILRDYLIGDVNNDGEIDIADINSIIAYMMGYPTGTFIFENADCAKDDIIDIADINTIINMILNGTQTYYRRAHGINHRQSQDGDRVIIEDFEINAGETRDITLHLDATRDDYCALQFDIDMPDGIEIVGIGSTDKTHTFVLSDSGDRILAYSGSRKAFGNEGIATLTVSASNMLDPQSVITIDGVIFGTTQCDKLLGSSSEAHVGNTTGVKDINANTDKVYASAGSIIIESQQDCLAQVVATNGSNRPVTVQQGHNQVDAAPGFYVVTLNGKSYKVIVK